MTATQVRWVARTIRETAKYYGLRSGGSLRRGELGTLVAQCVCCFLLEEMGISLSEIGSALRLDVPEVERSLGFVRKHRALRADAKKIQDSAVIEEVGLECAIF